MATKILKLDERVTIVGTGKDINMPKDQKYEVHPQLAGTLVKSGKAAMLNKKQ